MLFKTILPALVALVCIYGVTASPQVTTALPFEVVDGSDLPESADAGEFASGVIVGTGADGTTYVLSAQATDTDDEPPVTFTLIENASAATAILSASVDGIAAVESIGCGLSDGSADCTEAFVAVSGSQTTTVLETTSGIADTITVVVSTSSASASKSTGSSASSTSSGAASTQSSSAGKNAAAVAFVGVLPLVLAAVAMA